MGNNPLLNQFKESYPVDLYDMEIVNAEERREKRLHFEKAYQAASYLGIPPAKLTERIGMGKYAYQQSTNKKFAARKAGELKSINSWT